jgi:YbbR domain-containing protein
MTRNFPLKALSFLIAMLLAYAVHSAGNASVVSLFVPLEVKNAPDDKILVKPTKRGVQVTLKGPSFLVGPLASSPPALQARLPDDVDDRVTVTLKASDISLPHSVEVLSIEPQQVDLFFDSIERREVKVEVPRFGQLAPSLLLEGIEVTPKTVTVKGPRTEVKQLKAIETEPVNVSEISQTTELTRQLRSPGSSMSLSSSAVSARVIVGQMPSQLQFLARPVEVRIPRGLGSFLVEPGEVAVTVSGPPEKIMKLSAGDIIPYVRMSELPKDLSSKLKVQADVPDTVKVLVIDPPIVAIKRLALTEARRTDKR